MKELIGREVEVGTPGMTYSGKLLEMTETEITLQTETAWISVPVDQVSYIKKAPEGSSAPLFDPGG